jgi:hypothetical protein
MKKIILILIIISFSDFYSQTTKLKVSESAEFRDEKRSEGVLALHTTPSGKTGLIRASKKSFLVDVFDKNLNQTHTELIESSKKEYFFEYVTFGDEIKFITIEEPSKRERIVYCITYNIEKKSFNKKELFKANVEKGGLFTGRNKRSTNVVISPNGQYIAIATDNVKKNLNSYLVHVFDASTMNLVFKKSYQEHEDNYFEPNDVAVDNDGNAFTLGKLFTVGKSQKKDGEANYEFMLYKLSKNDTKNIKIKLEEGKHVASLRMVLVQNRLNILGFYSEERAGRIKGGCNFNIDTNSLTINNSKNTPLPKSVYEDLFSEAKAERLDDKKKEFKAYYVDYVIPDEKGNTFVLAEEFYVTQQYVMTGPNGAGYYQTIYHYDDILVLKFDVNGDIAWGRSIFKKANAPSYNAFFKDDQLHVLLNSGKNLKEKSDGRTKVKKGFLESTALYDINFKNNGEVSYDKIQDNKGNNFYHPYYGTYNAGKFILMSWGRNKQFMMLE